jgi:predicted transcriptional regulator
MARLTNVGRQDCRAIFGRARLQRGCWDSQGTENLDRRPGYALCACQRCQDRRSVTRWMRLFPAQHTGPDFVGALAPVVTSIPRGREMRSKKTKSDDRSASFSLRLPRMLRARLQNLADADRRSLTNYILLILQAHADQAKVDRPAKDRGLRSTRATEESVADPPQSQPRLRPRSRRRG